MNRTGLIVALALATVIGVTFAFYPEIDLRIAQSFYVDTNQLKVFPLSFSPSVALARDAALWVEALLVTPAIAALLIKLILPRRKLLVSGRAIVFLISTLALGPGLLVNAVLKEQWGRPRPIEVTQFGGSDRYVAWWDSRGTCDTNCSFVSGDVSSAAWTLAPAALAPPQWRALAYGASLALGIGVAAIRVVQGGHFVSDAIFAGVFTFIVIWIVYGLIYRWPRTRLSNSNVERAIERAVTPAHDFIAGLFARKRRSKPQKRR
jgi:lipid A 4'-phosphatase